MSTHARPGERPTILRCVDVMSAAAEFIEYYEHATPGTRCQVYRYENQCCTYIFFHFFPFAS